MTTLFQLDFDQAFRDHQDALAEARKHQHDLSEDGELLFWQAIKRAKEARDRMYQAQIARYKAEDGENG